MSKRKPRNNGRFSYITAGISTTLVLVLVGTVVFFGTMADNLSRALRENFTVEVLLSDSINHNQAYDLQTSLKRQPYTRSVSYISKEKATKLQSEALNIDPNEFLGPYRLPLSFISKQNMPMPIRSKSLCPNYKLTNAWWTWCIPKI